jgi:hypothetical protein
MSEEEREIDVELDVSTVVKLKFLTFCSDCDSARTLLSFFVVCHLIPPQNRYFLICHWSIFSGFEVWFTVTYIKRLCGGFLGF